MDRYVSTENGEMLKCEQGAWVKHDDYEDLKRQLTSLTVDSLERDQRVAKIEDELLWLRDKFIEFNLREHALKTRLNELEGIS
jgi:hypothetical protein